MTQESPTGAPRWVKVFALVALIALVLIVVVLVAGGPHGPQRHTAPAAAHTQR